MIISILLLTWEPPERRSGNDRKEAAFQRGIQSSITKLFPRRSFSGLSGSRPTRPTHHNTPLPPVEADGWPTRPARMPPEDSSNEYLEPSRQDGRGGGCASSWTTTACNCSRSSPLSSRAGDQKNQTAPRGEHERWNVRVKNPNRQEQFRIPNRLANARTSSIRVASP